MEPAVPSLIDSPPQALSSPAANPAAWAAKRHCSNFAGRPLIVHALAILREACVSGSIAGPRRQSSLLAGTAHIRRLARLSKPSLP